MVLEINFYYGALAFLVITTIVFWHISSKREAVKNVEKSPEFIKFQKSYLTVYLTAMFADWLKGPYVYALYAETYKFDVGAIAQLFIMGFVSSLVFGTFAGGLADKYGRKNMCMAFALLYGCSALTKFFNDYWMLMLGRFLSGIATSLLFSSFEAWMVCEHNKKGFPSALLSDTFRMATLGNGICAVVAGLVAQGTADYVGNIGPFAVSLIPLSTVFLYVKFNWDENYGDSTLNVADTFCKAIQDIKNDSAIFNLGMAQSCFEGAMYAWVFIWNPTLALGSKDEDLHLGLIFATFMLCVMLGSFLFSSLTTNGVSVEKLPFIIHAVSCCVCLGVSMFLSKGKFVYVLFLVFEAMCGLFFPCYGTIRSQVIPEASRSGVMSFFRIPLNAFVILLLVKVKYLEKSVVFQILALTHLCGFLLYFRFYSLYNSKYVRKDSVL